MMNRWIRWIRINTFSITSSHSGRLGDGPRSPPIPKGTVVGHGSHRLKFDFLSSFLFRLLSATYCILIVYIYILLSYNISYIYIYILIHSYIYIYIHIHVCHDIDLVTCVPVSRQSHQHGRWVVWSFENLTCLVAIITLDLAARIAPRTPWWRQPQWSKKTWLGQDSQRDLSFTRGFFSEIVHQQYLWNWKLDTTTYKRQKKTKTSNGITGHI